LEIYAQVQHLPGQPAPYVEELLERKLFWKMLVVVSGEKCPVWVSQILGVSGISQ
jgi:hypothetical protein